MYTINGFFWGKAIFAVELLFLEMIFTYHLKCRKNYLLRVFGCSLVYLGLTFAIPVPVYNPYYLTFVYLLIFVLSLGVLAFCYKESLINIIFCGVAAYLCQHISYCIEQLIIVNSALKSDELAGYGSTLTTMILNPFVFIIELDCFLLVAFLAWLLLARKIDENIDIYVNRPSILFIAAAFALVAIFLNALVVYTSELHTDLTLTLSFSYGIISCLLAIVGQFALMGKKKVEGDLKFVENMWHKDKEHYELSKANINTINLKCHDLKHQIAAIKEKDSISHEELNQIEKSILFYDSVVKTGNDALDVVLTEKSFYCDRHGIRLTCMIDGERLNFMSQSDIYSLFGNALDNAIECVISYKDREKRYVRLSAKTVGRLFLVHIENYFDGTIQIEKGLPKTSKGDENFHGFGMLSMKTICEKYEGDFSYKAKNSLFMVDMVFSVDQE